MITEEVNRTLLELPLEDRLELARRLVESVVSPADLSDAVAEGIHRIEDLASGRVTGLTEEEFRTALQ
jgi:putative addiction module component (TIGR02574 family)